MAKDIVFNLKFDSNGQTVMGNLSLSASQLKEAVGTTQKQIDKSISGIISKLSPTAVAVQGVISGLENLSSGYAGFDKAMREVNTMAGKSTKEFDQLKDKVKELSKEIPLAREALAGGMYQVISNGVPEGNWLDFLRTSAHSAVGGLAGLN